MRQLVKNILKPTCWKERQGLTGEPLIEGSWWKVRSEIPKAKPPNNTPRDSLPCFSWAGSGKTTLLDVIACNTDQGDITGEVKLNGKPRTPEKIKECAAYVRQDDRLLPHLTVKETLSFVAKLKLPKDWSHQEIQQRVGLSLFVS